MRSNRGFTLTELLVLIFIIAILAVFAMYSIQTLNKQVSTPFCLQNQQPNCGASALTMYYIEAFNRVHSIDQWGFSSTNETATVQQLLKASDSFDFFPLHQTTTL